jgi:hypothetical protein
MAKKVTKIHYYQLRPYGSKQMKKDELDEIKEIYKNAIQFRKRNLLKVDQGDGSVSPIKGKIRENRYVTGALIYTQENNIAPKYNQKNQSMEAINIEGFDGLGFDAAFFYDATNMLLVIESKVPGPTLESLRVLMTMNYEVPSFEAIVVTSKNEYEKFINSKGVRNLKIKMLNLDNQPEGKKTPGVQEATEMVENTNGAYIEMKIGSGKNRHRFLDFQKVKSFADFAVRSVGLKHEVTKFEVDIVDLDSGKIEPIDLITNRIFDKISIDKERTISRFSIGEKIDQIESYYFKRKPFLDEVYRL